MKARDVAAYIESLAPRETCIPGDEFGLVFGDPDTEVTGIGVCWWATEPVARQAARDGINLLLVHEQIFTDEQRSPWYDEAPMWSKAINAGRMRALVEGSFVVFRYHSNWDALDRYGVPDSMGRELGLRDEVARGAYTRTYRIAPTDLSGLGEHVSRMLPHCPVRVFGDPERPVERVGILPGGFGGNQHNIAEELVAQGADAAVFADMIEYGLLNALELGLGVVETLHSVSEEPAMREMAALLAERFPDESVKYLPSGAHTYGVRSFDTAATSDGESTNGA